MWYLGGKIRISKHIAPIINSYINNKDTLFVDLFCGGCNIIDKIESDKRIANDVNTYLIDMWKNMSNVKLNDIDFTIEHYNDVRENKHKHPSWYVGFIGFHFSYGGKFFGGYAKSRYEDHIERSCRKTLNQFNSIRDVKFTNYDYKHYSYLKNAVIYCDPPYFSSTQKSTKYDVEFNHDEFWDWVRTMSKDNVVLVSEKTVPDDFDILWSKEHNSNMSLNKCDRTVEKLVIINSKEGV